jgi:hypothetical protein
MLTFDEYQTRVIAEAARAMHVPTAHIFDDPSVNDVIRHAHGSGADFDDGVLTVVEYVHAVRQLAETPNDPFEPVASLPVRQAMPAKSVSAVREDAAYREAAVDLHYRDGQIEIDDDAAVSLGSDFGAYVQAWVWVPVDSVWKGETDSDGAPCVFSNRYRCDSCGEEWDDQWSSACDDECPACDARNIGPYESIEMDLTGEPRDDSPAVTSVEGVST